MTVQAIEINGKKENAAPWLFGVFGGIPLATE
jgi:hypothetical protein